MLVLKKLMPSFVLALSIFMFSNSHAAAAPELESFDVTSLSVSQQSSQYSTYSSQGESGNQISTIGILKNNGATRAENIVVEVQYFDDQKKLADVVTQALSKVIAEPGKETAFKVSRDADKPKGAYVETVVRVVSAQQQRSRQGKVLSSLGDVLVSWTPILLLLLMLYFYMNKLAGKNSPSQRTVVALDKYMASEARRLEVTERLAIAVEKIASTK